MSIGDTLSFLARGVADLGQGKMQRLRARYGEGPPLIRNPVRPQALSPADARLVLELSPEPYSRATSEKRAALSHFEPRMAVSAAM
jgi:hypothetical protein